MATVCPSTALSTSQQMLPNATTQELEDEIARRVYDLGRRGGYVLAPCHNIGHDIPPENVVTLFEKAREFGNDPAALKERVANTKTLFRPGIAGHE